MYETQLETLSMINMSPAPQRIPEELEKYAKELRETVPSLPSTMIQALAWEGISDWLMRCPLDF